MNGTFLIAVGLAWPHVEMSDRAARIVKWALIWGTWANWFATELSAVLGTSQMTPIAGAGFTGSATAEALVSVLLLSTVVTMVPAVGWLAGGALKARAGGP